MSIFDFTKKLLPRIERRTVMEDLRTTSKEAVNIVQPAWDAAATYFKINKLSSRESEELTMKFYRNFDMRHASKAPSLVMEIERRIPELIKNITVLQSAVDKDLENDIMADGLTAKSAFILRASANVSLVTRYLMSLLNYLYTVEAKHFETSIDPALEICGAEIKYVEENFIRFSKLFFEYTMPLKEIIEKVPDVFLSKESEAAATAQYGVTGLDPFANSGISGLVGHPIYAIRLIIARWQNERYEAAKASKQLLELRLLYLQMQKDKTSDPIVAKEIERLQGRIEEKEKYLRSVEEDLGLGEDE